MKTPHKLKIINDPIYGFIAVPSELIFQLIEHPYFQRLRRISQMGLSYIVYPGAHHTRFQHALGAMYLMQHAIKVLRQKNVEISYEEEQALCIAILLHDIGHGPFSHAMEHSIVENVSHEELSLLFMEQLDYEFQGKLTLAIIIFKNNYHRPFFHQLVSGQLDMDRLDYLKRDSFYTGVAEGNINSQRIIAMLDVKDEKLVVEDKAIYSIEKFIVARRLMYWQVYLHKTSLVAEQLLVHLLKRAKFLTQQSKIVPSSDSLLYFLKNSVTKMDFNKEVLQLFSMLDDYDVVSAIKSWTNHSDFVLSEISKMILHRDLLKIKIKNEPFSTEYIEKKLEGVAKQHNLSNQEASYFVFDGKIANQAYHMDRDTINLLKKNGKVVELTKASDQLNIEALSSSVTKYYLCFPKIH